MAELRSHFFIEGPEKLAGTNSPCSSEQYPRLKIAVKDLDG
jgi:hypothetical protein